MFDIFGLVVFGNVMEEVVECGIFEVFLFIYICGCLLYDVFVIVDEV